MIQINNEEKIVGLMEEIRDIMKKHDKGVRPTVIVLMILLIVLILVLYFK